MIKKIKESKHAKHIGRFLFFCLIGGISFLIDWSFFNVFYKFGLGFILSTICSVSISMVFNFSVNRNVTFSAKGYHLGKQIFKWLIVYGFAILVRIGIGKLILIYLGETTFTANIAFIVGIAVSIPISFLGSMLWAFKKDKN